MKSPMLVSDTVPCAPSVAIVSTQKKLPMNMGVDKQMSQMQNNMKEMQQQMG